jgi:hypothetical protein
LYALEEKTGFFRKRNREPIQLTTGPTFMIGSVPSRDGKKLFAIGGAPLAELVRYDATSHQFSPFLSGISAIHLSFSKDAQWVEYASYPEPEPRGAIPRGYSPANLPVFDHNCVYQY